MYKKVLKLKDFFMELRVYIKIMINTNYFLMHLSYMAWFNALIFHLVLNKAIFFIEFSLLQSSLTTFLKLKL